MPDQNGNPLPGESGYQQPGLINTIPVGTGPVTLYTPATATAKPATASDAFAKEATAREAKAVGYEPAAFEVKPEQTVQEQIRRVIGENSPLLQQAEARARQLVNERGLLNSSIAVGEGQKALYDIALPIASADAQTYERAGTNTTNALLASRAFKAGAENTASQANAALGTDVSKFNAGLGTDVSKFNAGLMTDISKANAALGTDVAKANAAARNAALAQGADAALRQVLQTADNDTKTLLQSMSDKAALTRTQFTADTQLKIAQIDQETKKYLGQLDANNRQLIQTNASLANMYQETVKNIASIAASQTMTPEAKRAATDSQLNLLNEGLRAATAVATADRTAISRLNLGQYFLAAASDSVAAGSSGAATGSSGAAAGSSGAATGSSAGQPDLWGYIVRDEEMIGGGTHTVARKPDDLDVVWTSTEGWRPGYGPS